MELGTVSATRRLGRRERRGACAPVRVRGRPG